MIATEPHPEKGTIRIPSFFLILLLALLTSCGTGEDEINKLQQKVWKNPGDAQSYMLLGDALARRERYTEATEAYKSALGIDPAENSKALHALGAVSFNTRNYTQALAYFRKYLDLSPGDSLRLYDVGNTYMQMQQFDKAAEAYSASIENSREFIDAHYNLAVCYIHTGRKKEAMAIYEWLLDKNNYLAHSLQNHLNGK
ncbi:MAG: tetratricopeptide repeat protein [Chlorobiaceae bacterium]|nr:tetratricopeptide repeat protein [Chlorobiaceae bacterium]NTV59717.1 tetratricopeptide repeat protein [Chlorobiaceae bacterium]